jgi:hypothetical protein
MSISAPWKQRYFGAIILVGPEAVAKAGEGSDMAAPLLALAVGGGAFFGFILRGELPFAGSRQYLAPLHDFGGGGEHARGHATLAGPDLFVADHPGRHSQQATRARDRDAFIPHAERVFDDETGDHVILQKFDKLFIRSKADDVDLVVIFLVGHDLNAGHIAAGALAVAIMRSDAVTEGEVVMITLPLPALRYAPQLLKHQVVVLLSDQLARFRAPNCR